MAELKTRANPGRVAAFLAAVEEGRRADCETIAKLMEKATGSAGVMWGRSIVGYGDRRLVYPGGRELDWFQVGFSPRKGDLTLYGVTLDAGRLAKLGRHKTGEGCLYLRSLADVDLAVLGGMIEASAAKSGKLAAKSPAKSAKKAPAKAAKVTKGKTATQSRGRARTAGR